MNDLKNPDELWAEIFNVPGHPRPKVLPPRPVPDPVIPVSPQEKNLRSEILPFWSDNQRGVPNAILRSALFGVIRRGRRKFIERKKIAALGEINILYTGPRLDQGDLDVWEQLLHFAQQQNSHIIEFTSYSLLKNTNRSTGSKDKKWLNNTISRLTSTSVEIQDGQHCFSKRLVKEYYRNKETLKWVVVFEKEVSGLFRKNNWTKTDWEERKKLRNQPLCLWLHGFYSSHRHPFPIKTSTILILCGSEQQTLRSFRSSLKKALERLGSVTGWECKIENDLVQVAKKLGG